MRTEAVIVGGGPAGAATALFMREAGIDVTIVEQETFPRFHVGESMTGWAAETLRNMGLEQEMQKARWPIKYAGTVYGTSGTSKFDVPVSARLNETERRTVPTWQVRRSSFDKMLLDTAVSKGASLLPGKAIDPHFDDSGVMTGIRVETASGVEDIHSEVVIDASGRSTWLSGLGVAGGRERGGYEKQIAVFSHVTGAVRNPAPEDGNTLLFYQQVDHWAWFIPLDDETVSIGVVTPVSYFKTCKESKEDFFLRELKSLNVNLTERVADIELVEPVHATANFSYKIPNFAGRGYMCVGDSHRFIDPFFSFGIHLAMSEGQKAAEFTARYLDGAGRTDGSLFAEYEVLCDRGMDVIQDLVDSFWANPLAFGYLLHFTEHKSDILDILGGRLYDTEPTAGLLAMRRIIAKSRAQMSVA